MNEMDKREWKKRYCEGLCAGGWSLDEAREIFDGSESTRDYDEDPEMAASDELSYWAQNA